MATTHTLTATRRVAVGVSPTDQGADGVGELTRTAYAALLAAEWTDSDAAPSLPVHDYAKPLPSGDAWKACYGYDAAARTERAACGACCYSYAIPADALTGDPCNIVSVTALVSGDRYLDAGADCHVVLSSSATPPTVATLAARTPDATLCATGSQTEPPNKRVGVTATLFVEPGAAATAYVHVALLLHDYFGVRGAWIEGGAMLAVDPSAAAASGSSSAPLLSVEFSRSVSPDAPPTAPTLALDIGRPASTTSGTADDQTRFGVTMAGPVNWSCYHFSCVYGSNTLTTADFYDPQGVALAFLRSMQPPKIDGADNRQLEVGFYSAAKNSDLTSAPSVFSSSIRYVRGTTINPLAICMIRSGYGCGSFSRVVFDSSISVGMPLDTVVYSVDPITTSFAVLTDIGADAFWLGRSSTVSVSAKYTVGGQSTTVILGTEGSSWTRPASKSVSVSPLAATKIPEGATLSEIVFNQPLVVNGFVTILVAFRPGGYATDIKNTTTIPPETTLYLA